MKINIKKNINKYLKTEHINDLHEEAFYGVLEVLSDFIVEGTHDIKNKQKKLAWVCDAVMGSGKTTAITVLLKYLADNHPNVPVLLVFNEKNLMNKVYNSIYNHGLKKSKFDVIEQVHKENVDDVLHALSQFQFVCITQQRFRDLALGYGNWNEYKVYKTGQAPFEKSFDRLIIVDEMPILFNSCVFDISSKDNSVDWFDKLAEDSQLTPAEKQFGRTMIMMLMTYEMLESEGNRTFTKPLIEGIKDSKIEWNFIEIIKKIDIKNGDFESVRKFMWFKLLLKQNKVGAIDRHIKGTSIICSRVIPYYQFGNIIILDGTARWNNIVYENQYILKNVENYHSYCNRVNINVRDINTSKDARNRDKVQVHQKVASDYINLRQSLKAEIFPLPSKSDIGKYINCGVISEEQQRYFDINNKERESLPINLLNTKGKEEISTYNVLALLNIPIRNPQYYKQIAVGLYGVNCNIEQFETRQQRGNIDWFKNEDVQRIYEQDLVADLLQIIHRTNLRKIKSSTEIHIIIYTHMIGWGNKLQEVLSIPKESVTYNIVDDKYNFLEKCMDFARKTRSFLEKHSDFFHNRSFTAGQIIKGDSFKNFIKKNWDEGYRTEKIVETFYKLGINITFDQKNDGTVWKKFSLREEVHKDIYSKFLTG